MRRLTVVLCFALACWLCSGCGEEEYRARRDISVNGLAEVEVLPDMLTVTLGVDTLDAEPVKSHAENNRRVKAVLAVIKDLGIGDEDVQTGYVSLTRRERETAEGLLIFEGYGASTSVGVIVRDLTKYDKLVSGALKAGANRVVGLAFGYSKGREKRREARLQAIRAAREKAEDLARELGKRIGDPLSINQREHARADGRSYAGAALFADESYSDEGTTLAAGRLSIRTEVDVSFELLD